MSELDKGSIKINLDIDKLLNKEKISLLELNDCSLYIIEGSLKDKNDIIRYSAAQTPNLSLELLKQLCLSNDNSIKEGICLNKNAN